MPENFFFQTQSFLYLSEKLISCTHPKTQFFERKHFSRSFERTDLLARSPEVVEIELIMAFYGCLTHTVLLSLSVSGNENKKKTKTKTKTKTKKKTKMKMKTKTKMKNKSKNENEKKNKNENEERN